RVSQYATNSQSVQVFPAFLNSNQVADVAVLIKVRANFGDTPVPQSAMILGGFPTISGQYLQTYFDDTVNARAVALYTLIPRFAGTGPRHLVLSYANDVYV